MSCFRKRRWSVWSGEELRAALLDAVRDQGLELLDWDEPARQVRARVALLRSLDGDEAWPDWSDASLAESVETWLGPPGNG
ncbi:MAG: hypothetical protein R3C16_00795 [Hyphomonadaceae bacterium]